MGDRFFSEIIKKRKITFVMVALIVIIGVYSYFSAIKQENPEVTPPVALITCVYPGASAAEIEQMVCIPLEKAIKDVEGYSYSYSTSQKNSAALVLWLKTGSEVDVDKSWTQLRDKIDAVKADLPKQCEDPVINTELSDTAGLLISISSKDKDTLRTELYAKELEERLNDIEGIRRTKLFGKSQREIIVKADAGKLAFYKMSPEYVAEVLAAQNMSMPAGYVHSGGSKIQVDAGSGFSSVEDIENLVIGAMPDGTGMIRLHDIADVFWGQEEDAPQILSNGEPGILIGAYFEKNVNIVTVGKEIEKATAEFAKELPEGVTLTKHVSQPEDITKAIGKFMSNLITGVFLVIVIVCVGMSWRNAIVVSIAIPFSILVTFIAMKLGDIPVHEISTAGLIICLGMLVDNAIVVGDAIQVKLDQGHDKLYACVNGTRQSAVPILTSTLTTIAAFIPLAFLSGVSGEYIFSVPFTVIMGLCASYASAILLVPSIAYLFFKPNYGGKKDHLRRTRKLFSKILLKGLSYKKTTVATALGMFVFSGFLLFQMGLSFFPHADKDIVYVDISSEQDHGIEGTEYVTHQVIEIVAGQPEVTSYLTEIGGGLPKFYITQEPKGESPETGQVMMRVDLSKGGFKSNEEFAISLQKEINRQIIGGKATVKQLEHAEPAEAPVKIRLYGENFDVLHDAVERLKQMMEEEPETLNARSNFPNAKNEYLVDIDTDKAIQSGLTKYSVQQQLFIALSGKDVSVFRQGEESYDIVLKTDVDSLEEMMKLPLGQRPTGQIISLDEVATASLNAEYAVINRYEGKRSINVYCDLLPDCSAVALENRLKERMGEIEAMGVKYAFDGEGEKIAKYFSNALSNGALAVLLIYFILMIQFNSFKQPLIVMGTLPLAVIGSILGLFAFGETLSFTALLGIISLMGVVVNNAILLLDAINRGEKEGCADKLEAIISAADRRFRPIMLTTITTVIGLIPLAFSGSGLFGPMSIALMSGLIFATLLTLVFIPVLCSFSKYDRSKSDV